MMELPVIIKVEPGIFREIPRLLEEKRHFDHILVVSGTNKTMELAEKIHLSLTKSGLKSTHVSIDSSSLGNVEKLREEIVKQKTSIAIAIGGGKVIDTVKFASYKEKIPYMVMPTLLSSDTIASPIALVTWDNINHPLLCQGPWAIVIDPEILKETPERYKKAAIGDILGNLTLLYNMELKNRGVEFLSYALLKASLNNLLVYLETPDRPLELALTESLVLNGLALLSDKNLVAVTGPEHALAYSFEHIAHKKLLHGEAVATFTLLLSFIFGLPLKNKILRIYTEKGLLTSFKQASITENEIIQAFSESKKRYHHEFPVLKEIHKDHVKTAIKELFNLF